MKQNCKRMLKSAMAAFLVLSMLVGFTGCSKEGNEDGNKRENVRASGEVHEELGEVEVTHSVPNTASFFGKIQSSSAVFSDKHSFWTDKMPDELLGQMHLRAPLDANVSATVTKEGWIYVLTRATGSEKSQQKVLEDQGFEVVKQCISAMFLLESVEQKNTVLMGKKAKAGDTIEYESWGILIANGTVKYTDPQTAESIEKVSKRKIVSTNMDKDGNFAFYTNLPDSLDYVNDEWERHYFPVQGSIKLNGEVLEGVYAAKVLANTYIIFWPFFDRGPLEAGSTISIDATFTDGKRAICMTPQTFELDALGQWTEIK